VQFLYRLYMDDMGGFTYAYIEFCFNINLTKN
jgi:hypothetical protein